MIWLFLLEEVFRPMFFADRATFLGNDLLDDFFRFGLLSSCAAACLLMSSALVGIRSSTTSIVVSLRFGLRSTIIRVLSKPLCRALLRRECRLIPWPEKASLSLRTMQITELSELAVEDVWFEFDPS